MISVALAFGLIALMAVAAMIRLRLAGRKQRKVAAEAHRIAQTVKEYFTRSGAEVGVQCLLVHDRFLVLVESEPLKRFRYSHIVEASLTSHVEKTLGQHVDRVFWRFPLPLGGNPRDTADIKPGQREDEYVTQGIREAKTGHDYHVAEDSWEQFEKALQSESVAGGSGQADASRPPAAPENDHADKGECGTQPKAHLRPERVP